METTDAPAVGQMYEDTFQPGEWVTVLHVGQDRVSVQRRTFVARYPLPDFVPGKRFRRVSAEVTES